MTPLTMLAEDESLFRVSGRAVGSGDESGADLESPPPNFFVAEVEACPAFVFMHASACLKKLRARGLTHARPGLAAKQNTALAMKNQRRRKFPASQAGKIEIVLRAAVHRKNSCASGEFKTYSPNSAGCRSRTM